ncbi:MAG: hypothetical protein AMXMBFR46_11200 [Acidimicrobiia bacterium]
MEIVAYLRIVRRHWKLVAAATILGALLGAATTLLPESASPVDRTYHKATHTLFLDTSNVSSAARPIYTNLDQIAVLATTGDVPRQVAAELGGTPEDWTNRIFTVTNGITNTLDIVCVDRHAEEATTCADTFAKTLMANLAEREQSRFDTQRDDTARRLDTLQGQIDALDAQIAQRPPNLEILQAQRNSAVNQYRLTYERWQQLADQGGPATVLSTLEMAEAQPISRAEYDNRIAQAQLGQNRIRGDVEVEPTELGGEETSGDRFSDPVSRGILGALLGMVLGVGIAVMADRLDRRLRTREDVETAFGLPVLAEVPELTPAQQRSTQVLSATAPLSRTAEAYRAVRSSVMFRRATPNGSGTDGGSLVILVGSAGPKEGKTTTSANLATVFAETGARVLVVNCDFRRPTLHQYFGVPNEPQRLFETDTPGLWLITDVLSGATEANPAQVSEEQRRVVASARRRFDVIILDTAPMLTTNDATEIMEGVDMVVVTCRAGVTTTEGATRARELLSRIAAPVAGVVLLGSGASPNEYYYYYSRSRAKQLTRERRAGRKGAEPESPPETAFADEPADGRSGSDAFGAPDDGLEPAIGRRPPDAQPLS